ncbi:TPA: type II secretion system protein GspE, partial [Escherichia coli O157]|nr:type II secretion system protein GspE [Escherichia coli O157]HDI5851960.1 type II secretion system protein GspE [Escherichia coli]
MSRVVQNVSESRPLLPFSFSRTQRILLLREQEGNRVFCMEDTPASALLEVRRVA